jgi:hypothetical protein
MEKFLVRIEKDGRKSVIGQSHDRKELQYDAKRFAGYTKGQGVKFKVYTENTLPSDAF